MTSLSEQGHFDRVGQLNPAWPPLAPRQGSVRRAQAVGNVLMGALPAPYTAAAWAADPLHGILHDELRAQLDQALATLSANLSAVVLLRDIDGLSTEATAAQLGISPGAVKVRLHRAHLHLRTALAAYLTIPEGTEHTRRYRA